MPQLKFSGSKARNLVLYSCLKRQRTFNFFGSIGLTFCNSLGHTKHLRLIRNHTTSANDKGDMNIFSHEIWGTNLLNCFLKTSFVFIHRSINKLINVVLQIVQESSFFILLLSTWSNRWGSCSGWRLLLRLTFLSVHALQESSG